MSLKNIREKEQIENFDFNVSNQEVSVSEVKLKPSDKWYYSSYTKEQLKILEEAGENESKNAVRSRARLGLALKILEGGDRLPQFIPVIIPVKQDGSFGALKRATSSQVKKYDLGEVPPVLQEFMGHQHHIWSKRLQYAARLETLNRVYFGRLSALLSEMPEGLTFCWFEHEESSYYPLKSILFEKLEVKFAPYPDGERLGFFLELYAGSGQVYRAGTDYRVIAADKNRVYLLFRPGRDNFYFAVPHEPRRFDAFFRFLEAGRKFSLNDFESVKKALKNVASDWLVFDPRPMPLYRVQLRPIPVLKISERAEPYKEREKRIEIEFDYQSEIEKFFKKNPDKQLVDVEKESHFEDMCRLLLKNDHLLEMKSSFDLWNGQAAGYCFAFKRGDDLDWLIERGKFYLDKGFKIYSERRRHFISHTDNRLRIDIRPGIKWLEFKAVLYNDASGETVEIDSLDMHGETIKDKKGDMHLVSREDIERLAKLYRYAEKHGSIFRVPLENFFLIDALYDRRMEEMPRVKEKLLAFKKLQSFRKVPHYQPAKNFRGNLRRYQKAGFRWLRFLQEYDLSGCLADDMGLGKTVQTLALLLSLKEERRLNTSLLLVPVSAVPTWETEIEKFTPGLSCYRHLGSGREKDFAFWKRHDLVITSYATLRNDIETFKGFRFDYIVLDESQNIKNLAAQVSKAVKLLKGKHRLALSGTPIENNSLELWSLFDFLMPGFLGSRQWFKNEWAVPVEKHKDRDKTGLLKKMIYPFILRRKKEQVEKQLPVKTEILETLQMGEEQEQLYAETAQYYSDEIEKQIEAKGITGSSFKILEGMLRLRQLCLFPQLLDDRYEDVPSVKFDHFRVMLADILAEGHKVLVFSQFVKVLAIIKSHLDEERIDYAYIDGSVPIKKRKKMIELFQQGEENRVFLLSLKAGGVSLNLTAADYVIIFDPWWNPAVEAQAIDRSHRIGQTKKVIAYRMAIKGSIEEKMLLLQERKRELVDKLIASETRSFKNLSKEDILRLFSFRISP